MTALAATQGKIRRRAPRALCHECGDENVTAVCCNCGACLCSKHRRTADLERVRRRAASLVHRGVHRSGAPDALDRVPDPETPAEPAKDRATDSSGSAGSSSPNTAAEPKSASRRLFCTDCVPIGHPRDVQVLAAMAGILLGLAVATVHAPIGLALMVVSASWLGTRIGIGLLRRHRRGRRYRRLLFLEPRIRKLELTETVDGRCLLDAEGREERVVDTVSGMIDVGLRWTGEHADRAERHRRKAAPGRRAVLCAEAGHLVLRGAGQGDLDPPPGCEAAHPARICLRPRLAEHEVLRHADGRGDARWEFTLPYSPAEPDDGWRMPVWVTPSFAPNSKRRALDLRVQWRTADPITGPDDGPVLTVKELSRVVLEVPEEWGTVRQPTVENVEQVLVGQAADGSTRIEWKKPEIEKRERGSHDLSVSFSRPVDPAATVSGHVEIVFAEAASGITALQMHAPGGARRKDGVNPKIKTVVKATFELSLRGIQHQESRTVPDAAVDLDETESRPFPGCRPDEYLVVGLVRQLADESYLVKSVVEHPTRPGRGAGLQYRVWDVTGRRYRGVHPIDFRITITGDEAEPGARSPSTTSVRLIVRGVYASELMKNEIRKAYEEIWARIETAVQAGATGADGDGPRRQSEPLAAIGRHAARLKGALISVESVVAEAEREGTIGTSLAEKIHDAVRLDDEGW